MTTILYRYSGRYFTTLKEAEDYAISLNPQLLDDDIPDFLNSHIEEFLAYKCPVCEHLFFKGIFHKHGDLCSKECQQVLEKGVA